MSKMTSSEMQPNLTSNDNLQETIAVFMKRYYYDDIITLSLSYPSTKTLVTSFSEWDIFNSNLADMLLKDPDVVLEAATTVLREFDLPTGVELTEANLAVTKIPHRLQVREIRKDDVGHFIEIDGVIAQSTPVYHRVVEAAFECPFCHHVFTTVQLEQELKVPYQCPQDDGGCGRAVQKFLMRTDKSKYVDGQTIWLQDAPDEIKGGEIPQTITVYFTGELAGKVVPGDRVIITGIVRHYQKKNKFGAVSTIYHKYIDANSLEVKGECIDDVSITDEERETIEALSKRPDIYKQLQKCIAPTVYGNEEIKEAILLQQFSAPSFFLPDRTYKRGDSHILLVGDPGVAKSVLLRYAAYLAPRGIFTDGTGSSGAGLTAAVVRDKATIDGSEWQVRAGAMVLADRGLLAVDEIEKMDTDDRDKILGALESQKIPIAKAGINISLNSRCAMIAAANPKLGRFTKYDPIAQQINLPPNLISRFDLIYIIEDKANEDIDRATASHIMQSYRFSNNGWKNNGGQEIAKKFEPPIDVDLMRKYIAVAREINPHIPEEVEKKVEEFYVELRKVGVENDGPTPLTAREVDALARLLQARARAELRSEVNLEDVNCVTRVVLSCLKQVFIDPETGKLDVDWVYAGTSKSMRDRAYSVRELIRRLERDFGDDIPINEVLNLAEEEGIEKGKAEEIIEVMKRDGILFSHAKGVVKFVR